jgi:Fur family ferric uptake transcriptional regulator
MARHTRQREAVRQALGEAPRPVSPGEILDATRSAVSGIGIATVYRHLREMVSQGQAVAVKLPGGRVRYEAADKKHHHHFVCDSCERVFEVFGCPPGLKGLAPSGFSVERHEVILYGSCSECAGQGKLPRSARRPAASGGAKRLSARYKPDEETT